MAELSERQLKVEVERGERSRAVLKIEVPAEEVARAVDRAYKRLVQRTNIPGFRRGKAPRQVLERFVGTKALYDEAVNLLVPEVYRRAVDQSGIDPINIPTVTVDRLEEGKPLQVTAEVEVRPEVKLGDYRSIRIPWEVPQVSEEDIQQALEDLRNRHGVLVSVPETQATVGDFVLLRINEVVGTDRFRVGQEVLVELGGGTFPQEVEEKLIGARPGEQRDLSLNLEEGLDPEKSGSSEGIGRVSVTVADIKRKELPPLDDEFAKEVSGAGSLEELRTALRQRLMADAEERARRDYEKQVLENLIVQSHMDLPESLVNHEVDHLVEDLREGLRRQGLSLEYHLAQQQKSIEDVRRDLRSVAEQRLRSALILETVAEREGIAVAEEEVSQEIEKLAQSLRLEPSQLRQRLEEQKALSGIVSTLRRRKTLDRLVAMARGDSTPGQVASDADTKEAENP